MTCSCGYRFALDPKEIGFGDNRLLAAVSKASGNDSNFFTLNQLVSAASPKDSKIGCFVTAVILVLVGFGFTADDNWFGHVLFGLAAIAVLLGFFGGPAKIDRPKFEKGLARYEALKEPFGRLLRDDQPLADPPPEPAEPDVYDYGVEAIVICERDEIVDLLVLNGWHAENRALVVGESGYPRYLVDRANDVLANQRDVPVYVLHDASEAGERMEARVRVDGPYAISQHQVYDLGLSRAEVKSSKLMKRFAQKDGEVAVDYASWATLSPIMVASLAGQMTLAQAAADQAATSGDGGGGFG